MHAAHVWPFVAGDLIKPRHARVWIALQKQTQPTRNLDRITGGARLIVGQTANSQRRSRLRVIIRLHRGKLCRLKFTNVARTEIAADNLQRCADATDRKRDGKRTAVKTIVAIAQQKKCVHGGDGKNPWR